MPGRVDHDNHPFRLGLVFGDVGAHGDSLFDDLLELGAALVHLAHGRKAVHCDVEVHAHLLRSGDRRPHGRHKWLFPLELELVRSVR